MTREFSFEEIRAALELVLPPERAAELAASFSRNPQGEGFNGSGFTGDTLALLSLVSERLKEEIEAELRSADGTIDPEWLER